MQSVFDETREPEASQRRNYVGIALFMAQMLYNWITVNPFVDLTGEATLAPSAGHSDVVNQLVVISLFGASLLYALTHPLRSMLLRPRKLLIPMLVWFFFVCLLSNHPVAGVKSVILIIMTLVQAVVFLLLPNSEKQFAKLIGISTLIMLAVAYYGVVFLPQLSIHQAAEIREPMNAGLWRGHFPHKNSAASAMVVAAFIGLFVMSSWSRVWGMAIIVLSCFFLIHTGGKTASAMLPAVLLISWAFERFKFLRIPIAVGGIAMFNLVAVGAAVSPDAKSLVTGLGIDATFTNRADIWRYAFSAIADRPILGYGFQGFWQTPELVYSGDSIETWAVAAFNGHNSMLDITISTGIPGLVFTLLFVLILPLRSLSRGDENGQHSNVTRLFVRVWLYLLYNAGLETMFFEAGPLWFLFAAGLYAFRLRTAELVTDASENRSERPFTPASLARI